VANNEVKIKITGDAKGLDDATGRASKSLGNMGDAAESSVSKFAKFGTVGDKISGVGKDLTVGLTVPLVAFAGASVKAFADAEKASAQLEASLESTGAKAWISSGQIESMAASMEKKNGVDGDAIVQGAALLTTFTSIKNAAGEGNDVFDQAITLMSDYSVKTGTDASSAAMLFGKALNDPLKGMTALSKAGVQFTADQKEQIKGFVEAGDVMSAQKIILAELEKQFGGSAEAFGNTAAGGLAKAKFAFENVQEEIGERLLPVVEKMTGFVESALAEWDGLSDGTKDAAINIGLVAAALGPVLAVGGKIVSSVAGMAESFGKLNDKTGIGAGTLGVFTAAAAAQIAIDQKMQDEIERSVVSVEKFNRALDTGNVKEYSNAVQTAADTIAGIDPPVGNWERLNTAMAGALGALSGGVTGATIGSLFVGNDADLDKANAQLDEFRASIQGLDADTATSRIDGFAQSLREAGVPAATVNAIVKDLKAGLAESGDAADDAVAPTEALAGAQSELTAEVEDTRSAYQVYSDALRGMFDPMEKWTSATNRHTDAQEKVKETLKEFGPESAEYKRALDESTSAAVNQESALNELAGAFLDGSVSVDSYKGKLDQMVMSGAISRDEYNRQIGKLMEAKAAIDNIPVSKNTELTANTTDAEAKVRELGRLLDGLRTKAGFTITGGSSIARERKAVGGPVKGGTTYLVGEEGPELFTAPANGTIVPNDRLSYSGGDVVMGAANAARASSATWTPAAAGAAGITVNLTLHGGATRLDAELVSDAIEEGIRRGTMGPRFTTLVTA
jgi:hypothetical protein